MTDLAAPDDVQAVESIVRNAGTSFYRGMRVLPADRRATMYAVYAFCRAVDDIADEEGGLSEKVAGLNAWRARIAALYAGGAGDDPVTRVLRAAIERFHLRQPDFLAVIDGMQMDAEAPIVAPDLGVLDLYCDRVASAVGRLSVRAFGDKSEAADRVAHHLGRALQLTNILRDLPEDAARGRQRIRQEQAHQRKAHGAVDRHRGENPPPRRKHQNRAAQTWRQDWSNPHHQHQPRHQDRRLVPVREVADNRARDHHARRGRDRRDKAKSRQRQNRGRQRRSRAGHCIKQRGNDQR